MGIDGFLGGAGRNPKADCVVVACPVMWAAAPAIGGSGLGAKNRAVALYSDGCSGPPRRDRPEKEPY